MKKIKIWHIILTLIICPIFVGIVLKYLPSADNPDIQETTGNYSPGKVEGDYIAGDQISGDKIEEKTTIEVEGDIIHGNKYETTQNITQKSPSDYLELSKQKKEYIINVIGSFTIKHNQTKINILLNTYKNDDNTIKFLNEFKDIFELHNINVSIVPIIMIGGPKSKYPILIDYTSETKNQVNDFLLCFQAFIAKDKFVPLPKPQEIEIPKNYNISIKLFHAPYFNDNGRIYFKPN